MKQKSLPGKLLKYFSLLLIIASFSLFVAFLAKAWVEPSVAPTGGNIAAPLHTGTTSQTKQGPLVVNGGVYAQGANWGVYGYETDTGAYGLLGYSGYGGYFNGGVYTNSSLQTVGNIVNSAPSQGWLGLTGDLPGYSSGVYPTLKTNGGYIYFSATGKYMGYMGNGVFRLYDGNSKADIQMGSLWGHTGLLAGRSDSIMYFGSDQNFQFLNRSGNWGPGVYAQDFYSISAGVWMSQLCRANGTNCPSTSGLYLPLAGGVMNAGSRVGFNGGTSYGIGQGAASPNFNSIAVDTLETDGGVGGGGTLELNYYGGNAVAIGPGGTKPLYAAVMYDGNNTNYYVDPASTSRFNYLGRNYGWNWTEYDWNDTNYYMDLNNVSILNDLRVNILYDRQNTGYYVDPNSWSWQNSIQSYDIRSDIFYDRNNTGYYVNPASSSQLSSVYANDWFRAQGATGLYFQDYGGGWYMSDASWIRAYNNKGISTGGEMQAATIRANSNLCIGGDCRSGWPSSSDNLQNVTDRGWSTSQPLNTSNYMQAPIFYDTNSSYYIDPNGTSRLNQLYYVDSAYVVDLRPQYMYDWNDTNYYMDFNNTSRLNALNVNSLCIGGDCRSSWGGGLKTFIGATGGTYNGAGVGGYDGGDAKCNTAFSGSRMCMAADFANRRPDVTGWYNTFMFFAVAHGATGDSVIQADDCAGWTTVGGNYTYNTHWDSTLGRATKGQCKTARKILCCK